MACKFICDGCGVECPAQFYPNGDRRWFKPDHWYQRGDADGLQDACSRACIDKIAAKSGKSGLVLPV